MAMQQLNKEKQQETLGSLYTQHQSTAHTVPAGQDDSISIDVVGEELSQLESFLAASASKENERRHDTVFFQIHGANLYGGKDRAITGGEVPLFQGAALNLSNATLQGSKRMFRAPEAKGNGGFVTVLPTGLNSAIRFPMQSLNLKEDYAAGLSHIGEQVGFGTFNRLVTQHIALEGNQITMFDSFLVNNLSNVGGMPTSVAVGTVQIDAAGLHSKLGDDTMMAFLNVHAPAKPASNAPDVPEATTTPTATTTDTTDLTATTTTEQPEDVPVVPETIEEAAPLISFSKEKIPVVLNGKKQRMVYFIRHMDVTQQGEETKATIQGGINSTIEVEEGVTLDGDKVTLESLDIELGEVGERTLAAHLYDLTLQGGVLYAKRCGFSAKTGDDDEEGEEGDGEEGDEEDDDGIFAQMRGDYWDSATEALSDSWDEIKSSAWGLDFASMGGVAKAAPSDILAALSETAEDSGMTTEQILEAWDAVVSGELQKEAEATCEKEDASIEASAGASLSIPIVPGVSLKIGAGAEFSAGYSLNDSDFTAPNIAIEDGKLKLADDAKYSRGISAEVAAEVFLSFGVGVGISNVAEIVAALKASLAASASTTVGFDAALNLDEGHLQLGTLSLHGNIEAALKASLTGGISLDIFVWSKDLYTKTLASKTIAQAAGSLEASKNYGAGEKWKFESQLGASFMDSAYSSAQDEELLKKMLSDSENKTYQFDANQENFERIKQDFIKAKEIVARYKKGKSSADKNSATVIDKEGPATIALLIRNTEDRFYNQFQQNKDMIESCTKQLESLRKNSEFLNLRDNNTTYEGFQAELDAVKALLASEAPEERQEGETRLQALSGQIKGSGAIKANQKDVATDKAMEQLKTKDTLLAYERSRAGELGKEFIDNRAAAMREMAKLKIAPDEQSAALYKFYLGRCKKHLQSHYISNVASSDHMLEYIYGKAKEKHPEKETKHKDRIAKLQTAYDALGEEKQGLPNPAFYDTYQGVDADTEFGKYFVSAKGIRGSQLGVSTVDQLRAFLKDRMSSSLSSQDAWKYVERRDEYEALMRARAQTIELGGDSTSVDKQMKEKRSHAVTKERSFLTGESRIGHMFATGDDLTKARQQVQMVKDLQSTKRDGKSVSIATQVYERLKNDGESISKLIAFERSRSTPDVNAVKLLSDYAIAIAAIKSDGEANATKATSEVGSSEPAVIERNHLREEATRRYLDGKFDKEYRGALYAKHAKNINTGDFASHLEDELKDNFRADLLYSQADLDNTDYAGKGKDEDLSVFEQRQNLDSDDVTKALNTNINTRSLSDEQMIAYYDYKMREKDNDAANLYEMVRSGMPYAKILEQLARKENEDIREKFQKYLASNIATLITPRQIMNYESARQFEKTNPFATQLDYLADGDLDKFAMDKWGKDYVSKSYKKDSNTISLNQINQIELDEQEAAIAKHTARIQMLESADDGSSPEYTGKRLSFARSIVRHKRNELLENPDSLLDILGTMVTSAKESNDEPFQKCLDLEQSLETRVATLSSQQATCQNISSNARALLENPENVFNDGGLLSDDVLTEMEQHNAAMQTLQAEHTAAENVLQEAQTISTAPAPADAADDATQAQQKAQNDAIEALLDNVDLMEKLSRM